VIAPGDGAIIRYSLGTAEEMTDIKLVLSARASLGGVLDVRFDHARIGVGPGGAQQSGIIGAPRLEVVREG